MRISVHTTPQNLHNGQAVSQWQHSHDLKGLFLLSNLKVYVGKLRYCSIRETTILDPV